jgi:hypothetical protein
MQWNSRPGRQYSGHIHDGQQRCECRKGSCRARPTKSALQPMVSKRAFHICFRWSTNWVAHEPKTIILSVGRRRWAAMQWTKQIVSHFGGTRNGMVISWPARIKDKGGLRSQFCHLIDIVPTIYERLHERRLNGYEVTPPPPPIACAAGELIGSLDAIPV